MYLRAIKAINLTLDASCEFLFIPVNSVVLFTVYLVLVRNKLTSTIVLIRNVLEYS